LYTLAAKFATDKIGVTVNKYLTGKCLVELSEGDEEKNVIYICSHDEEGAMGFVINKQLKEFYFSDLLDQVDANTISPVETIVLHQGGPLEKIRGFVLHSPEYKQEGTMVIDDKMAVSSSMNVLNDIAFGVGPRYNLIALGYSGWEPKQLEQEIIDNKWIVVDTTPELLFKTPDEDKWQKAIDSLGFDLTKLCSSKTGNA